MTRVRRGGGAVVVAMVLALFTPCGAQNASSFLPLDHWAYGALQRVDGLGLLDGFDPLSRAVSAQEAMRQLNGAVAVAPPDLLPLVVGYRARLAEELGVSAAWPDRGTSGSRRLWDGSARVRGRLLVGYRAWSGRVLPGIGGYRESDWTGPRPVPVTSETQVLTEGGLALGPVAAWTAVRVAGTTVYLEEAYGVVRVGGIELWGGRRPWGYRGGAAGGLVLDSVRVDGGGLVVRSTDLAGLGDLALETTLSRASDNGWIGRPWLWTMRLAVEPHPRFGLGFSRGAMFGGHRNNPVTIKNAFKVFVGKHAEPGSGFENQIAAVDVWFRPPGPVPTVLRLEWGFEDTSGAISEQPGLVAGLDVPAVPAVPELAVGVEYTWVTGESDGHSFWYRHWWFHEGWTSGGDHLGHPLGGHGWEWRGTAVLDAARAGLRLSAQGFVRDRGEYNVFAPDREGRSRGVLMELDWRVMKNLELTGGVSWEEGVARDWRERSGRIGLRWVGGVAGR